MTRASTRLKRVGVAVVAIATIGAGAPALLVGSAQAANPGPTTQLTITPATQTGAPGACLAYTVTASGANNQAPSDTPTVTVTLTQNPGYAGTIGFCSPTGPSATGTSSAPATTSKNVSTTMSASGAVTATFGVTSSAVGTVNVVAAETSNALVRSNTATATFSAASPTPTPTRTTTPTPTPTVTPTGVRGGQGRLDTTTPDIQPNITGVLNASGLTSNAVYELECYSRPSTTYFTARTASVAANSHTLQFRILPGTNTRCYIRPQGNNALASNSVVINVHTTLSLSTVRTGVQTYIFQGRNLPRRAGQLITLYRVANGTEIRTSNLTTDSSGIYRVTRHFLGTGTFQFRVRTSQTLTNADGVSNTITVTIF